jgi:hypothetical protein
MAMQLLQAGVDLSTEPSSLVGWGSKPDDELMTFLNHLVSQPNLCRVKPPRQPRETL